MGDLLVRAEDAQKLGSFQEAVGYLELAAQRRPGNHRIWANLGNALWLADRAAEALVPCQHAVRLAPEDPVVYRGLANVYVDLGKFEEADRSYRRSSTLAADAATAWNHSQLLIGLERYREGYELAEARWGMEGLSTFRGAWQRCTCQEQLIQGALCLWSEQGFGDTLQHLRWLGPLMHLRQADPAPVVLEVEPALVRLLEETLMPGHGGLVIRAKPASGAQPSEARHVSLLSLPYLLGGAPTPARASWLNSCRWPQARDGHGARFHNGPPRIGVVWAAGRKEGDPFQRREYLKRSLSCEALARLIAGLRAGGFTTVNLQFGPDRDVGVALEPGFSEALEEHADFADTAELVAGLDLVISVDTAMAHLVGAMGRPGWLLLPWAPAPRWLRTRNDTPWYPSLRLFRQPQPGDWMAVVEAVLQAVPKAVPQAGLGC